METPTTAVARIINGAGLAELEEQTREVIISRFSNFLERASEWEEKALALKVTDISQVEEMKQAREARIILKNIRVEADKTRQELKADSLRYAKAVQGVYNLIDATITPIEDHLLTQEKFAEFEERKRLNALRTARQEEMRLFSDYVPLSLDLASMTEEEYIKFFSMAKAQHEETLRVAEETARKKKQEAEAAEEERKRLAKENAALIEKQKELKALARIERDKYEKMQEEKQAKLDAMAQAIARVEEEKKKEAQVRLDAAKAEEDARKKAERKAQRAPDKAKLTALAGEIDAFVVPSMKSEELQKIADGVRTLLTKTAVYIRQSLEAIEKA